MATTSYTCPFSAAEHPPSRYCSRPTSRDLAALSAGERGRHNGDCCKTPQHCCGCGHCRPLISASGRASSADGSKAVLKQATY